MAKTARLAGCGECGNVLHSANYPRKPRGPTVTVPGAECDKRFSFCCAVDGCRARATPPSVRFLGRKVYLGAVVVLATAMRHGVTPVRVARLRELLGVNARTLKRWRAWWLEAVVETQFWRAAKARLAPPVNEASLPATLVERFGGDDPLRDLVSVLLFLSPLSTTSGRRVSTAN